MKPIAFIVMKIDNQYNEMVYGTDCEFKAKAVRESLQREWEKVGNKTIHFSIIECYSMDEFHYWKDI